MHMNRILKGYIFRIYPDEKQRILIEKFLEQVDIFIIIS